MRRASAGAVDEMRGGYTTLASRRIVCHTEHRLQVPLALAPDAGQEQGWRQRRGRGGEQWQAVDGIKTRSENRTACLPGSPLLCGLPPG